MKSVKLEKANTRGYFLTIGDDVVNNRWAVTAEELQELFKLLGYKIYEIEKEIEEMQRENDNQNVNQEK